MRLWLALAGLNGLIAVAAGAFGWHGPLDEGGRQMFAMGSQYQLAHALALLAVAWLATRADVNRIAVIIAGAGFALGIVLFSGTLYAFGAFGSVPVSGAAPVGGFALMAAWITLVFIGLSRRPQSSPS